MLFKQDLFIYFCTLGTILDSWVFYKSRSRTYLGISYPLIPKKFSTGAVDQMTYHGTQFLILVASLFIL